MSPSEARQVEEDLAGEPGSPLRTEVGGTRDDRRSEGGAVVGSQVVDTLCGDSAGEQEALLAQRRSDPEGRVMDRKSAHGVDKLGESPVWGPSLVRRAGRGMVPPRPAPPGERVGVRPLEVGL